MRLLEIQPGITINVDRIDGIEKLSDMSCKVYCGPNVFEATLPYETIYQLLKMGSDGRDSKQEQLLSIAKTQGFYAG